VIHVNRSRVKAPASLAAGGVTERNKAVAFFGTRSNRSKTFTFSAYKHRDVVDALNRLFHEKCAYCESRYRATAPADIEHFRPKGAIVIDGKKAKPGYYWLASTWDNLLPSCIDCNRARTQPFDEDDEEIREVSGKENKFPLIDETRRARQPEAEASESGQRLLLHPCRDRPEAHLEFLPDGLVRARRRSRKGATSIEVYGLLRKGLKEERLERILRLAERMDMILFLVDQLDRDPGDRDVDRRLKIERARLERERDEQELYAGLARQFIDAFDDALRDGTARQFLQELSRRSAQRGAERLSRAAPPGAPGAVGGHPWRATGRWPRRHRRRL
jgi:uncharacterized protein (TIGR02646 family)